MFSELGFSSAPMLPKQRVAFLSLSLSVSHCFVPALGFADKASLVSGF